jgi:hypothetical protein
MHALSPTQAGQLRGSSREGLAGALCICTLCRIINVRCSYVQVALQQRMLAEWEGQLQAAKLQWQQQEAAARSAWQQELLQQAQEALGQEAAEGVRLCMLPLLQRSNDDEDDVAACELQHTHEQQLQAEVLQLPADEEAEADEASHGSLADA